MALVAWCHAAPVAAWHLRAGVSPCAGRGSKRLDAWAHASQSQGPMAAEGLVAAVVVEAAALALVEATPH